jgi:ectoine hydroxylase-related dioxygenase (phytanoyl-CoA dioxygenase family)
MNNVIEQYQQEGYYLAKKIFKPKQAQEAADWLRSQNLKKLAKSFMDQSPCDDLAKYQSIHNGDTPIAKIATDPGMLQIASQLAGDEVYIWGSLVNLKNAWYGRVDYYHQDYANYKPRGYTKPSVVNCFTFLDQHNINTAPLNIFPGSHKGGALDHLSVFDVNGMHKLVVNPKDLDKAYKKYGHSLVDAEPGDVLYFHSLLIHGSAHNISPHNRMIILTQVNPKRDKPVESLSKIKKFNLSRTQKEIEEAKRRYEFYKDKYERQLKSDEIIFNNPVPKEEI